MKKLLLATAIAGLSVSAQAAPTVYGKVFLTVDAGNVETTYNSAIKQVSEDSNESGLNSNGSRIGLKGSEALTANTDVLYQLEYGVKVDDNSSNFTSRDTYLGVANKQYGTLLAGRLTTIDDNVDFASVLKGNNVADIGPSFNAPRANNAFAYVSPNYNGAQFLAMYGLDSDNDKNSIDNEDQFGVAATYSTGPINAGASYITHGDDHHVRVSGNYAVSPMLTVGALYQISEFGVAAKNQKASPFGVVGDKKENTLMVSGEMKTVTPWTAYGQVTLIDNVAGIDGRESFGLGVGGKYAFTQAATGHLYTGYVKSDRKNVVYNGAVYDTQKDSGFGIGGGLEYKF